MSKMANKLVRLRYFILIYSFCIDVIVKGTTRFLMRLGMNDTSTVTKMIYVMPFILFVLYYSIQIRPKLYIEPCWFIMVILGVFVWSYIVFPENRKTVVNIMTEQAWISILVFFAFSELCYCLDLKRIFKISSYIYFIFAIIFWKSIDIDTFYSNGLYMTFGYFMIVPAVFFLQFFFLEKKKRYLAYSIISVVLILIEGNRGALLCYMGFIAISFLVGRNVGKKIFCFLVLGFFGVLIYDNWNTILSLMNDNIEFSRNLSYLLSGKFLSTESRLNSYVIVGKAIQQHWWLGRGVCSDRVFISGGELNTYAHNIFLEAFLAFGVPLATIISIVFFYYCIKLIKFREKTCYMFIPMFSITFFRLLISDSFIVLTNFYVLIALMFYSKYSKNRSVLNKLVNQNYFSMT